MATSPHPLSAKSNKGKAAETDALFQIRFNDNQPDLTLYLAPEATIAQFKAKIAARRPAVRDKQLRLIFGGQLLNDDCTLLQYSKLKQRIESQIVHRARPDSTSQLADTHDVDDSPIFVHCSASERTEVPTANPAPAGQSTTTEPPLTGFDRLREAGFSEEDIANFRQQFHLFRGNNTDADPNQIRNLEEEWMDNGGPAVHADGGSHITDTGYLSL
ncbi:hypothetical protein IWQ62_001928 [Dispira parvispora]|uniref:Ubiquitin-like domain-containing protein n=1 Tax=Dispira parvispora TaxID=1520584 RepID=A0A9W8E3A2_9FUNG|nr:hypothetical protein IWQ62_001928 [Dispira parvispora]